MAFPFDPELIEPAARADQIHGRTADALALSQVISLKRIADAAEALVGAMDFAFDKPAIRFRED